MTAFEKILGSMSVERFVDERLGKRPLYCEGEPGRFRNLLNWDALARLLETHPLEPPRLAVMKSGVEIHSDRYLRRPGGISRLDGGALALLLDTGAALIINHVDDMSPEIAELADNVGDCLDARTAVNLYASFGSEAGFGPHWDYHDVIVLQLAGRKTWPIYGPTRENPLRGDPFQVPAADVQPEQVATLEDGDLLHLPRGWIHAPQPAGEPSLHLTIAITRPTGAGFLEWLGEAPRDHPAVRAALPRPGDEAGLAGWRARMKDIVGLPINQASIDRFLAQKRADRGARPRFTFPHFARLPAEQWTAGTAFRAASAHCIVLESRDSGLHVIALGNAIPCGAEIANALRGLTSTTRRTLEEMQADLSVTDAARLRQILAMLVTMGQLSAE